ncbi:MAG: hypothetical protein FJ008_06955 [Chloroflexi bacterium]|nr:hypothetical protein [Chloroflexota bacterium]MBM3155060.1 hypothetical protein [Chloroflexota bacterium]MBM3174234.1 hypothetical protein [Chloroflexota bacterium]MBM4451011.1 hypothetical protein [Chloroflexota bacterium]
MKEAKKKERITVMNVCISDIRNGTYQAVPMKIIESVEVDDDGNEIPTPPVSCGHQFTIKLEKGYFCLRCKKYVTKPCGTVVDNIYCSPLRKGLC